MAREAIFIGYRRDDTADVAGRIYDALAARFGRASIFKDVDNLRPGADFGDYIKTILPRCRVVLVLIGPNWLDSRDQTGRRRLDDPHDWVRIEIETALDTPKLDVVPVLVNGAAMPRADELPVSLHRLLRRHAATMRRDPDFHDDIARLATALRASVKSGVLDLASLGGDRKAAAAGASGGSGMAGVLMALIVLGLAAGAGWYYFVHSPAQARSASIEGRWVSEGQDCNYAMRLVIDGDALNVLVPGAPASQIAITSTTEDGAVSTAEGSYARDGDNLVARLPDGSRQVFTPCS